MPDSAFPELVSIRDAARLLKVSHTKLYEMAARGELPGLLRVGKTYRVNVDALRAWIERNSGQAA